MTRKERTRLVLEYFEQNSLPAETELEYSNPFELLVAVVLSAQCTDKRVNIVTRSLFKRFPDAESLASASVEEILGYIRSVSYPNNKAKHLSGLGKMLFGEMNNIVPSDVEQLQRLPGVGRKTANVIASVVFDKPAMAVDTHVFRVSARLGLTRGAKNPRQAEEQLMAVIPEDKVARAHHWIILHGRYICLARKPLCERCALTSVCNYFGKAGRKKPSVTTAKQKPKEVVSKSKPIKKS
jgi:endonuclease-3